MTEPNFIYIEFENGDVFRIPKKVVAEDRANYYASLDNDDFQSEDWWETYEEEVAFGLNSDWELQDWLSNNMNWEDVEDEAEKVEEGSIDYSEAFLNAQIKVG